MEACDYVRHAFDEAVKIRLVADVPVGAFLSGGIDSTSVVASMALQSPRPIQTFSIGFEEPGFDELPLAAALAKKYGTEHHQIIVRPDSVDLVSKLVRHFDEPFGDSSAIPTYLVSEFAARHVKVALTGDGGDELFAGYESFLDVQRLRLWDHVPSFAARRNGPDRRSASLFGIREKLSADDRPAVGVGPLFCKRIAALSFAAPADAGVDAAGRRRVPDAKDGARRCWASGPTRLPRRSILKQRPSSLATCW